MCLYSETNRKSFVAIVHLLHYIVSIMKQLDFNELNILVSVVECGTFSAAATQLGVPKSKISRAIHRLEESMGGQIFYRTTREVSLTSLGKRLYAHALPGIQSLRLGLSTALRDSKPMSGTIRITAVEDIGSRILTPLIAKFATMHPQLRFDMIYSLDVIDLVKHAIDIAIRVAPTKQQTYRIRQVGYVEFIFVASPRRIDFTIESVRPTDLATMDLILWHSDSVPSRKITFTRGKESVTCEYQPRFRSTSSESMLAMAKLGLGIAHLPRFFCEEALRSGSVVEICRGWDLGSRPISIVTPARRKSSPSVDTFIQFLAEELTRTFA